MAQQTNKIVLPERSPKELFEAMGEQIDRTITVDLTPMLFGARPKLWEAAYKKAGRPLALLAAERLLKAVKPRDTIILSTGWAVPPMITEGESCGPIGLCALAHGFSYALGCRSVFVTEKISMGHQKAIAKAAELRVWEYEELMNMPAPFSIAFHDFPFDDNEAKKEAVRLLDETGAKAVITAEKNDVNEKGIHHTGFGMNMGNYTAKVEHLVNEAKRRGILTIGIGDMGNEIGFGLIHDEAAEIIKPFGKQCNCGCGGGIIGSTLTDCLVIGSCSNRGCYGLLACLAGLTGKPKTLPNREIVLRMMNAARDWPVYDGITGRNTFTDDGAPADLNLYMLEQLRWLSSVPTWSDPLFPRPEKI